MRQHALMAAASALIIVGCMGAPKTAIDKMSEEDKRFFLYECPEGINAYRVIEYALTGQFADLQIKGCYSQKCGDPGLANPIKFDGTVCETDEEAVKLLREKQNRADAQ